MVEDLRLSFPPNTDSRAYLVNDAGTNAVNVYRQVAGEVRFVDKWGTNDHAVIWTLP